MLRLNSAELGWLAAHGVFGHGLVIDTQVMNKKLAILADAPTTSGTATGLVAGPLLVDAMDCSTHTPTPKVLKVMTTIVRASFISTHQGINRNVVWRHFMESDGVIDFDDHHAEEFSADLVADLREATGRYPQDPRLVTLVNRLQAESEDFARRCSAAHVARHRSSAKTATATPVGSINIDCDVLTAPGSDLRIVVYTVAPGSEDASKLDLLRVTGMSTVVA